MKAWSVGLIVALAIHLAEGRAFAQVPADVLRQAYQNADAASHTRSELAYTVDKTSVRQVVTKVRPDRTQLVITLPDGQVQEAIVIGQTLYTRQANTWKESPLPAARFDTATSPIASLHEIFSMLTERPRQTVNGRAQRVFAGKARWQAGRNMNEGDVEMLIDAQFTLPTHTTFKGKCGDRTCTFTQTMEFSTSLTVTAPTVGQ